MNALLRQNREMGWVLAALGLAVGGMGWAAEPSRAATVIVQDTFTNNTTSTYDLHGTAPGDVDLPGGNWTKAVGWNWAQPNVTPSHDYLDLAENPTSVAISLGSYTNSTTLTIAADLNLNGSNAGADTGGVLLGFYATPPAGGPTISNTGSIHSTFSGLRMYRDGTMTLYINGANSGTVSSTVVDQSAWHHLSYDVNTADGSISNINWDGDTSTFAFSTTGFTASATAYATVGSDGGQNGRAYADNVTVSQVPEPASAALIGIGLGSAVLTRRRGGKSRRSGC
jgi:hypothetical protein